MKRPTARPLSLPRTAGWALACVLLAAGAGSAQLLEDSPEPLEGVGIDEHLNEALPLDLTFLDEDS